jgi:uncharacterized repeat protein (TIGR01451 family)
MRTRYFGWALLSALVFTGTFVSPAASQGDVSAKLAVFKVLSSPDGKEVLEPTDQVKPGDLVEYRVVYRNTGKKQVKEVQATLPIPTGMEYQGNTANPVVVRASADGKTFERVPLRREVQLANGGTEIQEVPYREYRFLLWDLASLAAGQETTVRARAQVNPTGGLSVPEGR